MDKNKALIGVLLALILGVYSISSNMESTEFAKVKAKTQQYDDLPQIAKQFLNETNQKLPQRGLYIYTDTQQPYGWFIVDLDGRDLKYGLRALWEDKVKSGSKKLSDIEADKISFLASKIWATEDESKFTSDLPARVTLSFIALSDKGIYRGFGIEGLLEGEVGELYNYLASIIS